jgi:hypothetical protein
VEAYVERTDGATSGSAAAAGAAGGSSDRCRFTSSC